jgi:hypothetical protein
MAAARFKDLCIDAVDPRTAAEFWGHALGLRVELDRHVVCLTGPTPRHTIWINEVPEPKTVKNRVHWDVAAPDLQPLLAAGAQLLRGPTDEDAFSVLADPDGNEFCVFPD